MILPSPSSSRPRVRFATTLLSAAALLGCLASGAGAAEGPLPSGPAASGARWIVDSLSPAGLLPSPTDPSQPSPTATAQAVSALAATGGGAEAVDRMLDALAPLVDDIATEGGTDSAGGLGTLIGAVVAGGRDPHAFGVPPGDLVARLVALRRPDGLFGFADPTYDGTYRQGLALLGLRAAGETDDLALDWLEDQQCASGLWTSFRADTSVPCPPPDAVAYTGPDSNSTALAVMALSAHGRVASAAAGVSALLATRAANGGWNFILGTDMATDAASTALVAIALRMVNGSADTEALEALVRFQAPCSAPVADRGGVAYQPGSDGSLVPDAGSTNAAVIAFAQSPLPVPARTLGPLAVDPCAPPSPVPPDSTTTTTAASGGGPELPRTGTSNRIPVLGLTALGLGLVLRLAARRR